MTNNYCRRSRHSFNPAPGSVKRSDLLGVCDTCQAETVIEWHNRSRWEEGHTILAVHTATCTGRRDGTLDSYKKGH